LITNSLQLYIRGQKTEIRGQIFGIRKGEGGMIKDKAEGMG
jgi:hypothetical protein